MRETTYQCSHCGAKLDPSGGEATLRCAFCGTVTERSVRPPPPRREEEPAERAPATREGGSKDLFVPLYVAGLALLAAGTFGYAYLHTSRSVVGTPIVADVDGDGVEDVIAQWDEDVRSSTAHLVGLIDGRSHRIGWTFPLDPKHHGGATPMALGHGYVIAGESKPVADVIDAKTGAPKFAIDLPGTASQAYANGASAWVDTDEGALRIDAATGQSNRVSGSPLDPARPAWAPIDAGQTCPRATCRESAPMPIADMNVDHVYVDGSSDEAVAFGQKQTGTHLPMLAGISMAKRATRWSRVLQTAGPGSLGEPAVARGRIYFEYGDGAFRHLACASVATGELVWDAKSEENARAARRIVAGDAVYVVRTGKIEEYDAKDGGLLARFP